MLADRDLCAAVAATIPDEPGTAIAHHVLRTGRGRVWITEASARPAGVLIEWNHLPGEIQAFGGVADVAALLREVDGWDAVLMDDADAADELAAILAAEGAGALARMDEVDAVFRGPLPGPDPRARLLGPGDLALLERIPDELALEPEGWPEELLNEGLVAAAVSDGRIVARALSVARSARFADVGVHTLSTHRGWGLATACATLVARELLTSGLTPVWSTAETNLASRRVAAKLGFVELERSTYVVRP